MRVDPYATRCECVKIAPRAIMTDRLNAHGVVWYVNGQLFVRGSVTYERIVCATPLKTYILRKGPLP